jgi:hypothetical protein
MILRVKSPPPSITSYFQTCENLNILSEAVCKETLRTASPFASPFSEFSQHQAN